MELFEPGPIEGKSITAEVCVHHLFFDERWYESKGALIKCNPAIKSETDKHPSSLSADGREVVIDQANASGSDIVAVAGPAAAVQLLGEQLLLAAELPAGSACPERGSVASIVSRLVSTSRSYATEAYANRSPR